MATLLQSKVVLIVPAGGLLLVLRKAARAHTSASGHCVRYRAWDTSGNGC